MTTKRIVWLSLACLIVLAMAGTSIYVYLYMNSGPKLLARTNLALKAGKLDKAVSLTESYIAKYPDDWRGYYYQAKARSQQGNYALAWPLLDKASSLKPTEPAIVLANAETHSLPASRALSLTAADPNIQAIDSAVKDLADAVRILSAFKPADDKAAISVNEAKGLDYRMLFVAKSKLAGRLEADAKVAEASKAEDSAQSKREAAAKARAEADDCRRRAIRALLDVVLMDASRDTAAEPLVRLCLSIDDRQSLEEARKAIGAISSQPPVAAMLLAVSDLTGPADHAGTNFTAKLDEAARKLDVLLASHPDDNRLMQQRAELAIERNDIATARRLVTQILKSEPRNSGARLLQARVYMAESVMPDKTDDQRKQACAEADRMLYALTTEFPQFIQAHYYYAVVADDTGRTQLAGNQMRAVTQIDPGGSRENLMYRAAAHKYFARDLLAAFPGKAFEDAREAYRIDPNDPEAMLLLVESANRSDRSDLARETLEEAFKRPDIKPKMLVAVADGYKLIADDTRHGDVKERASAKAKADEALQLAADCRPDSYDGRVAVAEALIRTNRGSQADKLLSDAILEDANNPQAHYYMARRYDSTGRGLQAREEFRKAIKFDSRSPQYRLALAYSLVKTGDLDEALAVLKPVLAVSGLARQCERQIRSLQGLSGEVDAAMQDSSQPMSELPRALACLQGGQAQQCERICEAELDKDPANFEYRVLLARTLLMQGKLDDSIKLWSQLIAANPAQLPLYEFLASAMSRQAGPRVGAEDLYKRLLAVPSSRPDLANVAVAELCSQSGGHAEAAAFYNNVVQDPNCDDTMRYRARLLHANSLALANQPDQALAVLDKMVADKIELKTTLANKINLLVGIRRLAQAEAAADELFRLAQADHDGAYLYQVAGSFAGIGNMDKALAACDAIQSLRPRESGAYVLRARILESFGKFDEAGQAYSKAIELNPTDLSTYVSLANNLDARQKPIEAMDTLRKLEGLGQAARLQGMYAEANLFARRGLRNQAADRLKAIDSADIQSSSPARQLELANAMAALDLVDPARAVLVRIPERSPQYMPAGRLLANLAETTEKKLALLRVLTDTYPGNDVLLADVMKILMGAGRQADAVNAFENFMSSPQAKGRVPIMPAAMAAAAAINAGNLPAAMRTARLAADSTGQGKWRLLAATLAVECDPNEAARLLSGCDQAQLATALLGLCLAGKAGDANAAGQWLHRLDDIGSATASASAAAAAEDANQLRLLCGVIAGDDSRVKSALDKLKAVQATPPYAASELADHYLASASGGPDGKAKAMAEAGKTLRAELALSLLQPDLARRWLLEVLKARPTCQWAAKRLMESAATPASLREIAALLQPPDCYLAKLIRARILSASGKYDQASKAYESLISAEKHPAGLLLERAGAEERAGNLQKALDLYQQSFQAGRNPVAANNAAYVMSRLFPKDRDKLDEAKKLSDEAMKGLPQARAFCDTTGWIAYLQSQTEDAGRQGRIDDARRLLRQAVMAMPTSAEVHYHLGMAEKAAKNLKYARMHLAQAAAIADSLRAQEPNLKSSETEAGDLARQEWKDIPPD